jgi:hypothetical protein
MGDLIHLLLDIKLSDDDFASPGVMDLRSRLVELIEQRDIGEVGGFGSGMGSMDISVHVSDEAEGRQRLSELMREVAPGSEYAIKVLGDEDTA